MWQYGESINVASWFSEFAAVYGHRADDDGEEPAQAKGKKPRKRASRKVLQVWPRFMTNVRPAAAQDVYGAYVHVYIYLLACVCGTTYPAY